MSAREEPALARASSSGSSAPPPPSPIVSPDKRTLTARVAPGAVDTGAGDGANSPAVSPVVRPASSASVTASPGGQQSASPPVVPTRGRSATEARAGAGAADGSTSTPRGRRSFVVGRSLSSLIQSEVTLTKLYKDRVQRFKLLRSRAASGGADGSGGGAESGSSPDASSATAGGTTEFPDDPSCLLRLPRGGCCVETKIGLVQIGVPPETIKDHMGMGLTVPTYYVVPMQRFDPRKFINLAEIEFPTFFNFFVLKKRVKLITTRRGESHVRKFFREALLGPAGDLDMSGEFSPECPPERRPDLRKEMDWFSRDPANPGKHMQVGTLIDFVHFAGHTRGGGAEAGGGDGEAKGGDDSSSESDSDDELPELMVADLGEGVLVEMRRAADGSVAYTVKQDGEVLATVPDRVVLPDLTPEDTSLFKPFQPPPFGLTFLGTSHGFDPDGQTTGFVIWVNGQGVMVDPPPNSGVLLQMMGIPPRLIDTLILTHCHADHDAGTLQKILEEGQITLMTTPTVASSFVRKYSALTGIPSDIMYDLFRFRPVRVGAMVPFRGAHFRFNYSLHAVPCVSFEVFLGGKSIVYSGDTFNDPEGIQKMHEAGVLSAGRRDALIDFPWNHTVVLHEAGVPPIHTPMTYLGSLPDDVKRRLRLVHVTPKMVPKDKGLILAREGPEHTIRISVDLPSLTRAVTVMDLIAYVRFLKNLALTDARMLLQLSHVRTYSAGEVIVARDTSDALCGPDDEFFMVASGVVGLSVGAASHGAGAGGGRLRSQSVLHALPAGRHSLTTGNYFPKDVMTIHAGDDVAKAGAASRDTSLEAVAQTDVQCVVFNAHEFWRFLEHVGALPKSSTATLFADADSVLTSNTALAALTPRQKKLFRELLVPHSVPEGTDLWSRGSEAQFCFLVSNGKLKFEKPRGSLTADAAEVAEAGAKAAGKELKRQNTRSNLFRDVGRGAFLCDLQALRSGTHTSRLTALSPVTGFKVSKHDLSYFARHNPVVLLFITRGVVHT